MSDPSSSSAPKAIGSLAKKQSDVTRQGTQKLKFVPTLPQRRKKEDAKPEPSSSTLPVPAPTERGRGRGRGRGDGRGRGRGRDAAPAVEMTASGPFAMGPSQAGSSNRRATPRSNFAPSIPTSGETSTLGKNLSHAAPPSLKKDVDDKIDKLAYEDEEVYSDPDDGVEIVDIENIRQMDYMAPESLRKERQRNNKKIKKEDPESNDADLTQALDLSESEEEEELEDIIEDFTTQNVADPDNSIREERLYFFQFPSPFPTFLAQKKPLMDVDPLPDPTAKKVSFAADVKSDIDAVSASSRTASTAPSETKKPEPVDGLIGQLEVYRSGAVKIRLANNILLDVNAATQPSFLQQAVLLDRTGKQLTVLGEVNKQFVVSPNVDALLNALEEEERTPVVIEGEDDLLTMD